MLTLHLLLSVTIISLLLCGLILWFTKKIPIGLDIPTHSPQKFHTTAIPRLGGIAIYFSLLWGALISGESLFVFLLCAAFPAFIGGVGEDITEKISPTIRLWLTFISAGIAWFIIDAQLHRVGVYIFDDWLAAWWWLSLLFTMFAVGGVAHSVNIIDGYNGLMGGVSLLAAAFFAIIAWQLGDFFILQLCLLLFFAILGFFLWNYPWGKIFMGDGGSYTIGFILAEIAVLLVARHHQITPWSGFLIMAYPIVETLFSMYRKKILRKMSAGQPDGLHLHMLVYKRIILPKARREKKSKRWAHMMTSIILYGLCLIPMITTLFTYHSSALTLIGLAVFVTIYLGIYYRLLMPMVSKKLI
jgi:UDP-N-acetylmuramyl pentapeptide phosphotransferase/UDP-N-acetylglucosamine-1-phosphate transferase